MTTEHFTKDYVTYDKYGLLEVRCMACNTPIRSRMEEISKIDDSKFVYVVGNHSNYREIPVYMKDGSIFFMMMCTDHENIEVGGKEAGLLSNQIFKGKELELQNQGKPVVLIDAVISNMILKKGVVRRLTQQEIKTTFGGNK